MTTLTVGQDQTYSSYHNSEIPTVIDQSTGIPQIPEGNYFWHKVTRADGRTVTNLGIGTRVASGNRMYSNTKWMTYGVFRDTATGTVMWDDEGLEWAEPQPGVEMFGIVVVNPDNQPSI